LNFKGKHRLNDLHRHRLLFLLHLLLDQERLLLVVLIADAILVGN
jgi:hypothetical protein